MYPEVSQTEVHTDGEGEDYLTDVAVATVGNHRPENVPPRWPFKVATPLIVESYKLLRSSSFFGPGGYAVRVNAMWAGSLVAVIFLFTALLAIYFKQWRDGCTVSAPTCLLGNI
jgi:hypothetical protein